MNSDKAKAPQTTGPNANTKPEPHPEFTAKGKHPASLRTTWMQAIIESDLDTTSKHVALTLGARMDPLGECWPGLHRIAKDASRSPRTIMRALDALEKAGWIERRRDPRAPFGRGHVTHYQAQKIGHHSTIFARDNDKKLGHPEPSSRVGNRVTTALGSLQKTEGGSVRSEEPHLTQAEQDRINAEGAAQVAAWRAQKKAEKLTERKARYAS